MGGRPSLLLTVFLLGAALADQPPALAQVVELTLPDHLGGEDSVAAHRGAPVMVMVVNAKRLRLIKDWERDLRDRFPELAVVRIADLPADSDATLEQVRDKYRGRLPDDIVVLIDLERRWSSALELDTDRPCLLLLDGEGELVASFRDRYKERAAEDVREAVAALVGEP